jgi:hypothetical protein
MRAIKFRQPLFDHAGHFKNWHYWGFAEDDQFDGIATGFYNSTKEALRNSEQFTGQKDKAGTEVYQGDILRQHPDQGTSLLVFWDETDGAWMVKKLDGTKMTDFLWRWAKVTYVVSNITVTRSEHNATT